MAFVLSVFVPRLSFFWLPREGYFVIKAFPGYFHLYMSQRMTKPTIRYATSKDSDQPALSRSLFRVFADLICLLQP